MKHLHSAASSKRGITVLGLLLLIIALVIAAVFLVRYLRSRPAPTSFRAQRGIGPAYVASRCPRDPIPRAARNDIIASAA
jgi:flagellar biogenesis protein FliO